MSGTWAVGKHPAAIVPPAALAQGADQVSNSRPEQVAAEESENGAIPPARTSKHRLAGLAGAVALAMAIGALAVWAAGRDGTTRKAAPVVTAAATTSAAVSETSASSSAEPTDAIVATPAGGSSEGSGEASGSDPEALAAACKSEGALNLIALPDEWARDRGVLASFGEKHPGVTHNVAVPEGSSQDEEDAVQTLAGHADQPDDVDVDPVVAQEMVDKGLFEPYTPSLSSQIPQSLQDPDHNWVGAYYGVMAIATNASIVPNAPKSFSDLAKPEYKGLVALNGDPRVDGSAFAAVIAAALANGGSADNVMPGIQFFADLKQSGNLAGIDVTEATLLSGQTPITIDWSYNVRGLAQALQDAGLAVDVNFPADGAYGGFSAQGVVKGSPHQACSKLWLEHILSDDGALGYLADGALPARYQSLVNEGKVTDDLKTNLPPDDLISHITFLTPAQIAQAKGVLDSKWGPLVADAG